MSFKFASSMNIGHTRIKGKVEVDQTKMREKSLGPRIQEFKRNRDYGVEGMSGASEAEANAWRSL